MYEGYQQIMKLYFGLFCGLILLWADQCMIPCVQASTMQKRRTSSDKANSKHYLKRENKNYFPVSTFWTRDGEKQHKHRALLITTKLREIWAVVLQMIKSFFFRKTAQTSSPTLSPKPAPIQAPTIVPISQPIVAAAPSLLAPTVRPTVLKEPPKPRCSCSSCDETAWNTLARGHSCGDRIMYLHQQESNLYPTMKDACARVANIEYPDECGLCDPISCDDRTLPSPATSYCSCDTTCTLEVWKSETNNYLSCEALVMWVQSHDTERNVESVACQLVAEQFPDTKCGQFCNPTTCNTNTTQPSKEPKCGCLDCTDKILSLDADGNSCSNRIQYLQSLEGGQMNEKAACAMVAGSDFPDICGPHCDPSQCNKQAMNQPTTVPVAAPVRSFEPTSDVAICPDAPITSLFGKNVWIMDTKMQTTTIRKIFECLLQLQENNEMGPERYSVFFLPGTYGSATVPLNIRLGYYTEVAGLGASPNDVIINGKIEVYNRCFLKSDYGEMGQFNPASPGNDSICIALNNFWRSISNLSVNITHLKTDDDCRKTSMFWAISQASSMRRVNILGGDLSLMDYCSEPGYASGGFIADSKHSGKRIFNGSQQQFFVRNSVINEWYGSVWNNIFLGVEGAPETETHPNPPITTFPRNPLSREKPFLFVDKTSTFFVNIPSLKTGSRGVSWQDSRDDLIGIPLSVFFLAQPHSSPGEINAALASGKNLIFLPGLYELYDSIIVQRPGTIVLGLGLATLKVVNGVTPLKITDNPGIIVSGLIIDAGSIESSVLLQIGDPGAIGDGAPSNPITLHDIYFRVGGPYIGKAIVALEVNSNHVLIDHCWVWRADHGIEPFDYNDGFAGDNQRWAQIIGKTGVVVNGNDVSATGLFVEHFQDDNLIWKGERGRVFFYQNELPYDPPTQEDWPAERVGYKVDDSVVVHELWGGGVYCYNRNNFTIVTNNGFKVPVSLRVKAQRLYTRNLSGPGTIRSVINGVGNTVTASNPGPEYVA